jgi:dienelactone hydrolase
MIISREQRLRRLAAATVMAMASAASVAQAGAPPVLLDETQPLQLATGVQGQPLVLHSASPASIEAIIAGQRAAPVALPAQLFLPPRPGPHAVTILTPGSGGLSQPHLRHARALLAAGIGVLLYDPFGPRGVKSTVVDQGVISFAASTLDVLVALRQLAQRADVDPGRIAVLGYSRGGFAAHAASMRQLADVVVGPPLSLRAAVAAWPYCGLQFQQPNVGTTALRFMLGERDNWVSPVQCQALVSALQPLYPQVSMRLFKGAGHGFGYDMPQGSQPQAIKVFNAPVLYTDDRGVVRDPYTNAPLPGIDERGMLRLLSPFIERGVTTGPNEGDVAAFEADLVAFLREQLRVTP